MKPNTIFIILIICLFESCCPCKHLLSSDIEVSKDNTHIEYRERTVHVPDTVFIQIPEERSERTTNDSVSHLENDYSVSDARINRDGSLFHSLETKPQQKPVNVDKEIVYRDSIVYKYKIVTKHEKEIIEKKLTFIEKAQIWGCRGLIIIVVITLTIKLFRANIARIRKK